MTKNNYLEEANFCRLIRRWYEGEDEAGISAKSRCERRLELRKWLLETEFSKVPTPSMYIRGIPCVTYEGLLLNCERKIQMYTWNQCYNPRAAGTQEVEQFFSLFRDLDPAGSGKPRPDDIPAIINRVIELDKYKLVVDR